jgi:hypothetical protein
MKSPSCSVIRIDRCETKILNPTIVVMKSAQDGTRTDDTGALYRARDRRILTHSAVGLVVERLRGMEI